MSTRAKLIGSVAFALVALVAWRFYSPTAELPLVDTLPPAAELATGSVALVTPKPVAPVPARTVRNELMQRTPAASQPAPPVPDANALGGVSRVHASVCIATRRAKNIGSRLSATS